MRTILDAGTDFPVQNINDIVGADTSPAFARKITVGQRFFNAVLYLLGCFFQLHGNSSSFISSSFFTFLGVDWLEHSGCQLCPGTKCDSKMLRQKCAVHRYYLALERNLPIDSNISFTTSSTSSGLRYHCH